MGVNEGNYLLFLAASLPIWSLFVSTIVEGSTALLRSKAYIDSFPLPMGIYIVRSVAANFITFAHLIVVFFVVMVFMRQPPPVTMIAVIPALLIMAVFGVGAGLLIAPLSGRYRDLSPAIAAITNLMFVLTPVFWVPTAEQRASFFVKANPAFYMIDVARQPLLGSWGSPDVWVGAILVSIVTLVLGSVVFARMRPSIVYWL
jgi:ABC-type polysaccharide/polyol phosphate export permease